ncbi:MAG: xanthine phosphoribosyltransferase [Clostridia bacterium]|nr:xanthine phosphoribosyltransferase [Clostridia bacterium]
MKALERKIVEEGKIFPGNIVKVSGFLNHRIDVKFMMEMGKEIARLYPAGVNKILTIEASGIAIAVCAANFMNVPVVFAKKGKSNNIQSDVYAAEVESFTHGTKYNVVVSKEYLSADDKVLIIDDFLANGNALRGLISIVGQAGGEVVGCAIAIEKGFQRGGDNLRKEGVKVQSLAIIDEMTDDSVRFREQ